MQETLVSANRHLIDASAPLLLSTKSTTHVHFRWNDVLHWLLPYSHAFPTTFTYDPAYFRLELSWKEGRKEGTFALQSNVMPVANAGKGSTCGVQTLFSHDNQRGDLSSPRGVKRAAY